MEGSLDFEFTDGMAYKITYFWPSRTKEDSITEIMRYQKSDVFEKWHYTFSHPLQMKAVSGFKGPHIAAGECGIRPDEFVKIEPVTEDELQMWKKMTQEKIDRFKTKYGGDPCEENVNTATRYVGEAMFYQ